MRAEYDFSAGKRGAAGSSRGKTRISIYIDNAVLGAFREWAERSGTGYQTLINAVLKERISGTGRPLTEGGLREIIREEIPLLLRKRRGRPATRRPTS
jgi:hypothetical protein